MNELLSVHILWPPNKKADSLENTLMLGKIEGRRRREWDGWDGWTASLTQCTWIWATPGDGEGQGGLACCSPWGHKESDTTEWLNNNNLFGSKEENQTMAWPSLGLGGTNNLTRPGLPHIRNGIRWLLAPGLLDHLDRTGIRGSQRWGIIPSMVIVSLFFIKTSRP